MTEFRKMAEEKAELIDWFIKQRCNDAKLTDNSMKSLFTRKEFKVFVSGLFTTALTQAYKSGQEKMRERCVEAIDNYYGEDCNDSYKIARAGSRKISEAIRNLNIEEDK